ncbi:isochorismatase family protein [Alteromonas flava]|uniref:isochorismatase family protein n=1 Tax=Alteromonas flava TaxID=2048003 RepID=UPI000C285DE4|nr:isochorismatase family protein [Alteromonas flava]
MHLFNVDHAQLLLVDVQAKLFPHIDANAQIALRAKQLLTGAQALNIPITIVEQYPQGLGPTLPELLQICPTAPTFIKQTFSALKTPDISQHLDKQNRQQLIILGTESHVCVLQTALDAKRSGYDVILAWDACGSRYDEDKRLAEARLRDAECQLVSAEMLLFEWLESREHAQFSAIIAQLRQAQ